MEALLPRLTSPLVAFKVTRPERATMAPLSAIDDPVRLKAPPTGLVSALPAAGVTGAPMVMAPAAVTA